MDRQRFFIELSPKMKVSLQMKKSVFILLILCILLASCKADAAVVPEDVLLWLRANAVPFLTAEPDHGCEDLQPLLDMIGDARIVALGENTHGTHEYRSMRQRIVECLVTEKNFNIVASEVHMVWARDINEYIMTGEGDISLLLDIGQLVNTEEDLQLIEWMRQYNSSRDDTQRVDFRGFDVTGSGDDVYWDLYQYIETVDPNSAGTILENLACFKRYVMSIGNTYYRQSAEFQAQCQEGLQAVLGHLVAHQADYSAAISINAYTDALHDIRLLIQYERLTAMSKTRTSEALGLRDRYMAVNASWFLDNAGLDAKMIIVAHNAHIQDTPVLYYYYVNEVPQELWEVLTPPTMGMYLRERYGNQMVTIGVSFYQGQYNAFTVTDYGLV